MVSIIPIPCKFFIFLFIYYFMITDNYVIFLTPTKLAYFVILARKIEFAADKIQKKQFRNTP